MLFHYKILNKEGKVVEGDMEAKDKFALYHTIKQDGATVVSAEEIKDKKPHIGAAAVKIGENNRCE